LENKGNVVGFNKNTGKMKYTSLLLIVLFAFPVFKSNAQIFGNDPEIRIDGLQPESVWQIAEMAMNDNSIPLGRFNQEKGILMSDWIEWTAIAIKNHAHIYLKYESPALIVKIADRQYASSEGWSEAIGNLSKKNYKEYVQNVADRITEISKDADLTKKAVKSSKLIPAFNPVFTVEGLVFKLMKTTKDESKHLLLEFTVHNETQKGIKVDIPMIEFQQKVEKVTGASGNIKWSPTGSGRYAEIQPDETLSLTCEYAANWELNTIPQFDVRVICNEAGTAGLHIMPIYSITFPYTYQEGD